MDHIRTNISGKMFHKKQDENSDFVHNYQKIIMVQAIFLNYGWG